LAFHGHAILAQTNHTSLAATLPNQPRNKFRGQMRITVLYEAGGNTSELMFTKAGKNSKNSVGNKPRVPAGENELSTLDARTTVCHLCDIRLQARRAAEAN
jgi:hypothetical protein